MSSRILVRSGSQSTIRWMSHDPEAGVLGLLDLLDGDAFHELAYGHDLELALIVLAADVLDHAHGIDAGSVHENHWLLVITVGEQVVDDVLNLHKPVAVHEVGAELIIDPVENDRVDVVGAQRMTRISSNFFSRPFHLPRMRSSLGAISFHHTLNLSMWDLLRSSGSFSQPPISLSLSNWFQERLSSQLTSDLFCPEPPVWRCLSPP